MLGFVLGFIWVVFGVSFGSLCVLFGFEVGPIWVLCGLYWGSVPARFRFYVGFKCFWGGIC